MSEPTPEGLELHTDLPHPARVYDYWLGGKDNFAADREMADAITALAPDVAEGARAQHAFLQRAAQTAAEAGVRQFVHAGVGLPTQRNTHEIVHETAPDARVVYVEDEPISLVHARALLDGEGLTSVVEACLRDAEAITGHPELRSVVDFTQPVCLLVRILSFIHDDRQAHAYVAGLRAALAPGSYLVVPHVTADADPQAGEKSVAMWQALAPDFAPAMRTHRQILRFLTGLELLEPGLVPLHLWRPDREQHDTGRFWAYGAMARVP